jgi:hypothetical protein
MTIHKLYGYIENIIYCSDLPAVRHIGELKIEGVIEELH